MKLRTASWNVNSIRIRIDGVPWTDLCAKQDSRHLAAMLAGGIELHDCYVPSGGNIPDPEQNDKFAHKSAFLAEVDRWFRRRRKAADRAILVGDLNVAPESA